MERYVFLWDKIRKTSFYKKPKTLALSIHLLLRANHKEKNILLGSREITIGRGECLIGRRSIALETGMTTEEIRAGIKELLKSGFIEMTPTNQGTIIKIKKYVDYQFDFKKKPGEKNTPHEKHTKINAKTETTPTNNITTYKDLTTNSTTKPITKDKDVIGLREARPNLYFDFVCRFKDYYGRITGFTYNASEKDYGFAKRLIDKHGVEQVVKKTQLLAHYCKDRSTWFTKDGFASFDIPKLYCRWNNILPNVKYDKQAERENAFIVALKKAEKERENANEAINRTGKNAGSRRN